MLAFSFLLVLSVREHFRFRIGSADFPLAAAHRLLPCRQRPVNLSHPADVVNEEKWIFAFGFFRAAG